MREFIEKSGLKCGESVFDMGCGSGTLCVPLAEDGYTVFAGDFSEKMLNSGKAFQLKYPHMAQKCSILQTDFCSLKWIISVSMKR